MGLVIDTSALVAAERGSGNWDDTVAAMGDEAAVVPAIVYAELLVGVELAADRARAVGRRAKIDALMSRVPLVEFGAGAAAHWAELFATLSRAGRLIPANDLAVAATARALGGWRYSARRPVARAVDDREPPVAARRYAT